MQDLSVVRPREARLVAGFSKTALGFRAFSSVLTARKKTPVYGIMVHGLSHTGSWV